MMATWMALALSKASHSMLGPSVISVNRVCLLPPGADNRPMQLHFLIFDASDDGHGVGTWEAMASVRADQVDTLMAEVQQVLHWAQTHSPGPQGSFDEGGVWDIDTLTQTDGAWTTVTLTVTGPWAWGEVLITLGA